MELNKLAVLVLVAGIGVSVVEWPVSASKSGGGDLAAGVAAYERGDHGAALAAWLPLAEAGDPEAQLRLGRLYRDGEGVRYTDFERAALWFRRAAGQGNPDAMYDLARLHYEGFIIPRDPAEMMHWLTRVTDFGHARAQVMLGAVYEYGLDDIGSDLTEALKWYELADKRGNDQVRFLATQAIARVGAKMTNEQIDAARQLAALWQPILPNP